MTAIPRSHHRSEHDPDSYTPSNEWPGETPVQWGSSGLVFSRQPGGQSYQTAFFEAFPDDDSAAFIRGEGETIAAAEENALAKWRRFAGCDHRWGRGNRNSGYATCRKCGSFQKVFKPVWSGRRDLDQILDPQELTLISLGFLMEPASKYCRGPDEVTSKRADQKALEIRCKRQGLELPPSNLDKDTYQTIATQRVALFYAENRAYYAQMQDNKIRPVDPFDLLSVKSLEDMARRHGFIDPDTDPQQSGPSLRH